MNSEREPVRLLVADPAVSPAVRNLLLTPPPVKPLDAHVATRVRGAVLQTPVAASAGKVLGSAEPVALVKLGIVATTAALFGAGVMTLVSGYVGSPSSQLGNVSDGSGVMVLSTSRAQSHHGAGPLAARVATSGPGNVGLPAGTSASAGAEEVSEASAARHAASHGQSGPASSTLSAAADDAIVGAALDNTLDNTVDGTLDNTVTTGGVAARARYRAGDAEQAPSNAILSVDDLASADEGPFHGGVRRSNSGDGRVVVRPAFRHIASAAEAGASRANRARTAPRVMSSLDEETVLLEDARTKLGRDPEAALTLALEHQARFRRGQLLEQRRMIHLEALLRLGRDKEALELAKSIGSSLYQARARALLAKYRI